MFFSVFASFVFLLGGTSVVLSQTTLTLMLVVLGIVLMGVGFGHLSKEKESLRRHRWTLTVAVALTLVAVFLVMLPSAFNYLIDPNVNFLSALSVATFAHAIVGVFAVVSAVIYVFGDLPQKVQQWMRITALLWVAAVTVGVILFLQAQSLI